MNKRKTDRRKLIQRRKGKRTLRGTGRRRYQRRSQG
jgi:hypothetical protein